MSGRSPAPPPLAPGNRALTSCRGRFVHSAPVASVESRAARPASLAERRVFEDRPRRGECPRRPPFQGRAALPGGDGHGVPVRPPRRPPCPALLRMLLRSRPFPCARGSSLETERRDVARDSPGHALDPAPPAPPFHTVCPSVLSVCQRAGLSMGGAGCTALRDI